MVKHHVHSLVKVGSLVCSTGQSVESLYQAALDTVVTGRTEAQTCLKIGYPFNIFHKVLFGDTPSDSCRWEVPPTVAFRKFRATIGTEGGSEKILVGDGIVDTAEE